MELRFASMPNGHTSTVSALTTPYSICLPFKAQQQSVADKPPLRNATYLADHTKGREGSNDFPVQLYCRILVAQCRLNEDRV